MNKDIKIRVVKIEMANITPMMQQYLKIKSEYDDCLLFLDLEISMKCSLMMLKKHQEYLK